MTHISDEKNRQSCLILIAFQSKIILETLQPSGGVVVAIDVVHEVYGDHDRHDQPVNFPPKFLFGNELFWRQLTQMLGALVVDALLANDVLIADSLMVTDIVLRCVHYGGKWSRMGGKGLEGRGKQNKPSYLKAFIAPRWQRLSNIATMMLLLRSSRR